MHIWTATKLLWEQVVSCSQDKSPVKISCCFLGTDDKFRVKLRPDWYRLLEEFSGEDGSLGVSKAFLEQNWASEALDVPKDTEVVLHCELRLVEHLQKNGHKIGVVGVSKDCCELCAVALQALNRSGSHWVTRGGHDRLYMGLLPADASAAEQVKRTLLSRELRTLKMRAESPGPMDMPTDLEKLTRSRRSGDIGASRLFSTVVLGD